MKNFNEMQLKPELVEALRRVNFTAATEVQEHTIPEMVAGRNVIVRAKTGTGKTAAFLVPIAQMMRHTGDVEALIIVPTRELALQVSTFAQKAFAGLRIRTTTVYGGASINVQIEAIRNGTNIVVGTPGRIIDLIERGALDIGKVRFMVLDEADVMLDMGFIEDVEFILSRTPQNKMMALFSATMPQEVVDVASRHTVGALKRIIIGQEEEITVTTIKHGFTQARGKAKFAVLLAYINRFKPTKGIIFAQTKTESDIIHRFLVNQGINAILLHGGLTQAMRERSLGRFKNGGQFMIATNIASRGLDINDVSDIINFDIPDDPHVYVHRVGRSARMGKSGRAFTIVEPEQRNLIRVIEYTANIRMIPVDLDIEKFMNVEVPFPKSRHGGFREHFGGEKRGGYFNRNREGGGGGGYRRQHNNYGRQGRHFGHRSA